MPSRNFMKILNHGSSNLQIKQTVLLFGNVLELTMCIVYMGKKRRAWVSIAQEKKITESNSKHL